MAGPVVVLGDLNVDLNLELPAPAAPGSPGVQREPGLTGGGTAGNTAAALARLGAPVEFAGSVGDDGFGRWLADDLAALGVGRRGLVVLPDHPTAQVIAVADPGGDRTLWVWPTDGGALTHLRRDDLPGRLLDGAAWLHTTGMCLRADPVRSTVIALMGEARAAGIPVSIDLNLRVELWGLGEERRATALAAVALADVVLAAGPEELVPLAGAATLETALDRLGGPGRTVVARLGAAGAVARTPAGEVVRVAGFRVAARNAVGAGDAFNAGFIVATLEGRDAAETLRWGNAVAALKVARPGGARDLPDRAETERLLAGR